jgi:hypothetical protein
MTNPPDEWEGLEALARVEAFLRQWEARMNTGSHATDSIYCVEVHGFGREAELTGSDLARLIAAVRSGKDEGSSSPKSDDTQPVAETAEVGLRPMVDAPKDETPILAVFRPDIYPTVCPTRDDLERWNGHWAVLVHRGLAPDGYDIGWAFAAPVGHGGFPDSWLAGWLPLPQDENCKLGGDEGRQAEVDQSAAYKQENRDD